MEITNSSKKENSVWIREDQVGDVCRRVKIEEVENGFIITKSKSWEDSEKGYTYKEKKILSKTNPLEDSLLEGMDIQYDF